MDVARPMLKGAHYHADVIVRKEHWDYGTLDSCLLFSSTNDIKVTSVVHVQSLMIAEARAV